MLKAAGAVIIAKDTGKLLLQLRSDSGSYGHKWGFWGGKVDDGENVSQGMLRELSEELGLDTISHILKVHPLDQYHSRDGEFAYYTFAVVVSNEFVPTLNEETGGYCWVDVNYIPRPLHPGAKRTLFHKHKIKLLENIIKDF